MYIRIYVYKNVWIYQCMCICTYVYMYMSMQCVDMIYQYTIYTYIYIYVRVECPFLGTCLAKFDDTKACASTTSSSAVCAAALPRTAGLWGRWWSLRHSKPRWEKSLEVSGFQEEGSQTMPKTCIKTLL